MADTFRSKRKQKEKSSDPCGNGHDYVLQKTERCERKVKFAYKDLEVDCDKHDPVMTKSPRNGTRVEFWDEKFYKCFRCGEETMIQTKSWGHTLYGKESK